MPEGVVNILTGKGSVVGMRLVQHPGVDKIALTGSTETGKTVMRAGADTLKKITLELGGKSPNIVLDDADLDAAVKGAYNGIFYGKGEVCAAGSRLFVDKKLHDPFMEKLVARTKKLQPADPLHSKTRLGAIVSEGQMKTVMDYIEVGKKEGAQLRRRRRARLSRQRQGQLRAPHHLRWSAQRHAPGAGRNFRPGPGHHRIH